MPEYLAILDWGIGGTDALHRLRQRHPELSILYISDTGAPPYGTLEDEEMHQRLRAIATYAGARGVGRLVVACNAASTAVPHARQHARLPIHSVIDAGVAAALATSHRRLGVIGGRRTITTQSYAAPLEMLGRHVIGRIAQPLSAAIERGEGETAQTAQLLRAILAPLVEQVDALILGCTHYIALAQRIRTILGGVDLIDPVERLVEDVSTAFMARTRPEKDIEPAPTLEFWTTGDTTRPQRAAKAAFGVALPTPIKIPMDPRAWP